ncbi:unnamed protein product [Rotaria sp. Silwood2]|nr:unnamed protein product [Rotaria sp. Silwood2]CAF3042115.1 unnamed protein product [Rotaria sp. Silwood2]CAF3297616.1 unnamed protein product [Rotaria sp. Silwood2]CAF3351255.1 unnamed protein product [Rotaria sp. Silwood2]CAF3888561.1 unnamed protein product [Rotaria sp. Silwood2]
MSKKKNSVSAIKQHENTDEQTKNRLFSDIDNKSIENVSYTFDYQSSQIDQTVNQHLIPKGVVDMDESINTPIRTSSSHRQHHTKPYTIIRPTLKDDRDYVYLPPINHHSDKHYSYEYDYKQSNYHHHHHHHHHHHNNNNHYRYDIHGGTYDPRWWYMPINSVHGPKSPRRFNHNYIPPKWYELPSRY